MLMISIKLYTQIKFIAYLQEMCTLFREMSANQVHRFSHVWCGGGAWGWCKASNSHYYCISNPCIVNQINL